MSVVLKLDKSKIKVNEHYHRLEVKVTMETAARILQTADGARNGLLLEINRYYPPRSNQANKKMWLVCKQIAEEISKEFTTTDIDVYQKVIRDCGVYQDTEILNTELQDKMRMWSARGVGWFCEERYSLPKGGKTMVRQYYGSSSYNSKQMSILIRSLIDDAANMGLKIDDPATMALLNDDDRQYVKAVQNHM